MRFRLRFRPRAGARRSPRLARPQLEALEDRLAPGDALWCLLLPSVTADAGQVHRIPENPSGNDASAGPRWYSPNFAAKADRPLPGAPAKPASEGEGQAPRKDAPPDDGPVHSPAADEASLPGLSRGGRLGLLGNGGPRSAAPLPSPAGDASPVGNATASAAGLSAGSPGAMSGATGGTAGRPTNPAPAPAVPPVAASARGVSSVFFAAASGAKSASTSAPAGNAPATAAGTATGSPQSGGGVVAPIAFGAVARGAGPSVPAVAVSLPSTAGAPGAAGVFRTRESLTGAPAVAAAMPLDFRAPSPGVIGTAPPGGLSSPGTPPAGGKPTDPGPVTLTVTMGLEPAGATAGGTGWVASAAAAGFPNGAANPGLTAAVSARSAGPALGAAPVIVATLEEAPGDLPGGAARTPGTGGPSLVGVRGTAPGALSLTVSGPAALSPRANGNGSSAVKDGGLARTAAQRKALALGLRYLYPDLTDDEIAQAVGVSRRTLFRWDEYNALKKAQRGLYKLPRGSKDREGNLEAWTEEEE